MQDPEWAEKAQNAKFEVAGKNLKTQADTLRYIGQLKELYTQKNSEVAFSVLCKLYSSSNMTKDLNALVEDMLKKNPKNFLALAYHTQAVADSVSRQEENQNWDAAIEAYKALLEASDGSQAFVYAGLGQCLCKKAGLVQDRKAQKALFQEALPHLERAKELDPDNANNWGYFLYVCYGSVYSYNDDRAVELKNRFGF